MRGLSYPGWWTPENWAKDGDGHLVIPPQVLDRAGFVQDPTWVMGDDDRHPARWSGWALPFAPRSDTGPQWYDRPREERAAAGNEYWRALFAWDDAEDGEWRWPQDEERSGWWMVPTGVPLLRVAGAVLGGMLGNSIRQPVVGAVAGYIWGPLVYRLGVRYAEAS